MGPIQLIVDKGNISIIDSVGPLIIISKRLMIMDRKDKVLEKEKSNPKVKAAQLAKMYAKAKAKYYKIKVGKSLSEKHKDYKHFISAIDIIERINCSYKDFIQAQIKGLEFVKKGEGVFPKVNQLSTDGAENRVLDFIRDHVVKDDEDYIRNTPLEENDDYVEAWYGFLLKEATLKQMKYIRKAQKARHGEVEKKVKIEIKRLIQLKAKMR